MDEEFRKTVDSLHPAFERLLEMKPAGPKSVKSKEPIAGVYLISEEGTHRYVGRTRNVRNRLRAHCSASSKMWSAGFAVLLARKETGFETPPYKSGEGSRNWLADHPEFVAAFTRAKQRIGQMQFRYVEEADPVRQAVLEIYCAVVLKTQFNSFKTT